MELIFNWKKACEEIYRDKQYKMDDKWNCKIIYRQQIALIKYLRLLGKQKDEIYDIWEHIPSKIIEAYEDDDDGREKRFDSLYTLSTYCGLLKKEFGPITIYTDELNYINNLECPKWMKIYFFGLVIVCKYYGSNEMCITTAIKNYIFSFTGFTRLENFEDQIRDYNRHLRLYENRYLHNIQDQYRGGFVRKRRNKTICKLTASVFSPMRIHKEVAFTVPSPEEIGEYLIYISDNKKQCSECGTMFSVTPNSKTCLCPECYKRFRQRAKNVCLSKWREKKKLEKDCKTANK